MAVLLLLGALGLQATGIGAGPRAAPVAEAGPDQNANVNDTVYFDGSGSSDPDGDTLTYSWDFDRSNGIQRDATGPNVSHAYASTGVYRVTLTVSDGVQVSSDECNVTVKSVGGPNQAPVAVISEPRNGALLTKDLSYQFDGSNSSDPDGDKLAYLWEFGDGKTDNRARTVHAYTDSGLKVVNLTVNDSKLSDRATVYVNVVPAIGGIDINRPPSADAGPNHTAIVGETLYFQSLSSDPDKDALKYFWDFDRSNGVNILNPDATGKIVTWVYNASGNFTVTHWVQEENTTERYMAFDTCWANISDYPKYPPLANAGANQTVQVDTEVAFSGSGISRNPGGSIKQYAWDFENDGVFDWTSNTTGKTKHTYTAVRVFVARLRVTDETGATAEDTTTITVTAKPNELPTADAGPDMSVFAGVAVTFQGTGTDPDGRVAKYQWDFNADGVWDYESPSSGVATFTYVSPGVYEAKLRVTDDRDGSAEDTCTVSVRLNEAPTADAGGDQTVNCGDPVQFDGSGSKDPEGQKLTYSWDFDAGNGLQADSTGVMAEHVYTKGGEYTVTLTVTDELGKTGKATAIVTVVQTAGASLNVAPKQKSLKPGEEMTFYLTLQNTGNGRDGFELLLSGDNYRWGSLDQGTVTLDAGAATTLVLRVSPPIDAAAGALAKITVRAISAYDPNTEVTTQVSVTVNHVYGLAVATDKANLTVEAGKAVSFTVRITNNGNGDDSVRLMAGGAATRWTTLSTTPSLIIRGGTKVVTVKLSVPSDASAQDYMLVLTAVSQDNLTQSATSLVLTVKKTTGAPGFEGGALVAAILVAGAAAALVRRRDLR